MNRRGFIGATVAAMGAAFLPKITIAEPLPNAWEAEAQVKRMIDLAEPVQTREERVRRALCRYNEEVFRYGYPERIAMGAPLLVQALQVTRVMTYPPINRPTTDKVFGVRVQRFICAHGTYIIPSDPEMLRLRVDRNKPERTRVGSVWFYEADYPGAEFELMDALRTDSR